MAYDHQESLWLQILNHRNSAHVLEIIPGKEKENERRHFFFCCDRSKKNLSHMRASHLAITQSFAFPIEFKELVRGLGP